MVANSEILVKQGSNSTNKTKSLSPEQELEILTAALGRCKAAGIDVLIGTMYNLPGNPLFIQLPGVVLRDGCLVLK